MPAIRMRRALAAALAGFGWVLAGGFPALSQSQTNQTNGASEFVVEQNSASAPGARQGADYLVEKNLMVRMEDGVRLATDVYRPARLGLALPGKFPVIVYRTPYGKDGMRRAGMFFAGHGYVVVAQDCRGRFRSEGTFTLLRDDGEDGYDTIDGPRGRRGRMGRLGPRGLPTRPGRSMQRQ